MKMKRLTTRFCTGTASISGVKNGRNSHGTDMDNPGAIGEHMTGHPGEATTAEETLYKKKCV